MIILLFDS